jgi:hypothetical protein
VGGLRHRQDQRKCDQASQDRGVIRIAISQEAFDAIARTLPFGSAGYENATDDQGRRLIWLDHAVAVRLKDMRGPGESFSDVILALVAEGDVLS